MSIRHWLKRQSLRNRLMLVISSFVLLIWLVATAVQWKKMHDEINDLFDAQIVLFAERIASSNLTHGFHQPIERRGKHRYEMDDEALAFSVFTSQGERIFSDSKYGDMIPFQPTRGFNQIDVEQDGDQWQVFWLRTHSGLFVAVGQELEYREDLLSSTVFAQMWVWLAGFPLILFAILWSLSHETRSLRELSQQVSQRKPNETTALSLDDAPKEIKPLVTSLNHYFNSTQQMLNRERRFTSDAAHELRSPLAGLRIQAELAEMLRDDPEAHQQALKNITFSIDKISQLIDQLLTLSRLENLQSLDELSPIDWQALIASSLDQLEPQIRAHQSQVHLNIASLPPTQQGKPILLSLVLRNLLENALNYTPASSQIYLNLSARSLVVEDDGEGVSEADLAKLGQPFYRPVDRPKGASQDEKGSGLGMSIVRQIAHLHGFQLKLSQSQFGGLKVEILF